MQTGRMGREPSASGPKARAQHEPSPPSAHHYPPANVLGVSEKPGCGVECYLTWDFQGEVRGRSCLKGREWGARWLSNF